MSATRNGVHEMATAIRQVLPQLENHTSDMGRLYGSLSQGMFSLSEGSMSWEGQAADACRQAWETMGPNLVIQGQPLASLHDILQGLADDLDYIYEHPFAAADFLGVHLPTLPFDISGRLYVPQNIQAISIPLPFPIPSLPEILAWLERAAAGVEVEIDVGGLIIAGTEVVAVAAPIVYAAYEELETYAVWKATNVVVGRRVQAITEAKEAIQPVPSVESELQSSGSSLPPRIDPRWALAVVAVLAAGGITLFVKLQQQAQPAYPPNLPNSKRNAYNSLIADFPHSSAAITDMLIAGMQESDIRALLLDKRILSLFSQQPDIVDPLIGQGLTQYELAQVQAMLAAVPPYTDDQIQQVLWVYTWFSKQKINPTAFSPPVTWDSIFTAKYVASSPNGIVYWLYTGDPSQGMQHIWTQHAADFLNFFGITNQAQVGQLTQEALERIATNSGVQDRGTSGKDASNHLWIINNLSYNGRTSNVEVLINGNGMVTNIFPLTKAKPFEMSSATVPSLAQVSGGTL